MVSSETVAQAVGIKGPDLTSDSEPLTIPYCTAFLRALSSDPYYCTCHAAGPGPSLVTHATVPVMLPVQGPL